MRMLLLLCSLFLAWGARAEVEMDSETDFHFRAFGIEPADRVEWGEGHLTAGVDREVRPERGTRRRTVTPLEATFGLGAGFSAVVGLEGSSRTLFDDGSGSRAASREVLLKYALPAWNGLHVAAFAGANRLQDQEHHSHTRGFSFNLDTDLGTFGSGYAQDRRRPGEPHQGREWGVNWFRLWDAGPLHGWGLAAEARFVRSPLGERIDHWLLGVARVVGKGLLADVAIGGSGGDTDARRLTAGISWFY